MQATATLPHAGGLSGELCSQSSGKAGSEIALGLCNNGAGAGFQQCVACGHQHSGGEPAFQTGPSSSSPTEEIRSLKRPLQSKSGRWKPEEESEDWRKRLFLSCAAEKRRGEP